MPKGLTALMGRVDDTDIVIVAASLFFIFSLAILIILRSIYIKLEIRRVIGLSISLVLVNVLGMLIILTTATSNPVACRSCHPMRAPSKELQSSSHKGIACISCHKKTSILATPVQKLEQARMLFSYLTGNYKAPISTTVGNDICLDCHRNILYGVKTRFRITMSHAEVAKAGIYCVDCHEEIAHKKKTAIKDVSMMERCSNCHNDEEASARCEVCHLDDVWLGMKPSGKWGIAHDKNWIKIHGSRSLYTCRNCHYAKDCKRCHDIDMPHPVEWGYIHGEEAKNNRKVCNICHKVESFCRGCHRINMPHPSGWLPIHQWEVEIASKKVCLSCHFSKDCEQCHEKHSEKTKRMEKRKP